MKFDDLAIMHQINFEKLRDYLATLDGGQEGFYVYDQAPKAGVSGAGCMSYDDYMSSSFGMSFTGAMPLSKQDELFIFLFNARTFKEASRKIDLFIKGLL